MARVFLTTCYRGEKTFQVGPPLGLLYLASSLRSKGHEVRCLDLRVYRAGHELALRKIDEFQPDIIGLSAVHREIPVAADLAHRIHQVHPEIPLVIGGPSVTSGRDEIKKCREIDYAILQEGEIALPALVSAIEAGKKPENIPGLFIREGDSLLMSEEPEPILDLDALPFPAWDLCNVPAYHRAPRHGFLYRYREYFSVQTSRGCPYGCTFCQNMFGRKFRYRSAESVLDEVEILVRKWGIREIHFPDDCFNLKRERALAIFQGIIDRKLNISITFPSGLRGDLIDEEFLDLAKRAGVFRIPLGIETASPRLQKKLEKNVDLEKLNRAIAYASKLGIVMQGFFMLGFPTETLNEVRSTIDFAVKSDLHLASFNWVNAFPGTKLWQQTMEMGLPVDEISPESYDFDNPPLPLADFDPAMIPTIAREANGRFYLNPRRLWLIFRALPNKGQLLIFIVHFFKKAFFNLRKVSKAPKGV